MPSRCFGKLCRQILALEGSNMIQLCKWRTDCKFFSSNSPSCNFTDDLIRGSGSNVLAVVRATRDHRFWVLWHLPIWCCSQSIAAAKTWSTFRWRACFRRPGYSRGICSNPPLLCAVPHFGTVGMSPLGLWGLLGRKALVETRKKKTTGASACLKTIQNRFVVLNHTQFLVVSPAWIISEIDSAHGRGNPSDNKKTISEWAFAIQGLGWSLTIFHKAEGAAICWRCWVLEKEGQMETVEAGHWLDVGYI